MMELVKKTNLKLTAIFMVTTITKNRNQNQNHLTDKKIHF